MTHYDDARYVGAIPELQGQVASIRPYPPTEGLPLDERKLYARWHNPDLSGYHADCPPRVGTYWYLHPVTDFKILIPIHV